MSKNVKPVNPMKVITGPETRWSYANVWEPKSINGGTPKYSVSLIIPKSDTRTVAKIKAAIEAAYDNLTQRFETAKQRLETVMAELDRMQTQRADIEAFVESFEALPDTLTEFKLENWHSLVDFATVYSTDDIRFTFKHGQEVQA